MVSSVASSASSRRLFRRLVWGAAFAWSWIAQANEPPLALKPTLTLAPRPTRPVAAPVASLGEHSLAPLKLAQALMGLAAPSTPPSPSSPPQRPPVAGRMRSEVLADGAVKANAATEVGADETAGEDDESEGPSAPVPFETVRAPEPNVRRSPPAQELPDLAGETWRLAPIRWGGNLSSMVNWFSFEGTQTTTNTELLNLRSASHIYQPWFAQVNGNLGLSKTKTTRSGGEATSGGDSEGSGVNFGGSLNLFPLSRFPLRAYFDHSDTRASASGAATGVLSTRYGLFQSYRPEVGQDNYSFGYDHARYDSGPSQSSLDSFQGNYSTTFSEHRLSAGARYQRAQSTLGDDTTTFNLNGTHNWNIPDEGLTISSTASYQNQAIRTTSLGQAIDNENQLLQANSTFNWIPDEDLPLIVNGGVNFLSMQVRTNDSQISFLNLSGNAGASYRFSERFIGTGNVQFAYLQSNQVTNQMLGGNASLSYSGNPLKFGEWNYNWNTGGSAFFANVSSGEGTQGVAANLMHSLNRTLTFSEASVASLSASQGVSLSATSQQNGNNGALTHSVGASWRLGLSPGLMSNFSATLSDTLSFGANPSHFLTVNLLGNGSWQISRRQSLSANVNLTRTVQQQESRTTTLQLGELTFDTRNEQWMGNASLTYQHMSPFDLRNLTYSATAQYLNSRSISFLLFDPLTGQAGLGQAPTLTQRTLTFQQRLEYRIGRVSLQMMHLMGSQNGKKNASLFLLLNRDFGDL